MKFIAGLIIGLVIAIAACSKSEEKPIIVDIGIVPQLTIQTTSTYKINAISYGRTDDGKDIIIKVDDEGMVSCK